jgi:hypothetical protein
MIKPGIKWTKIYELRHINGNFNIYISYFEPDEFSYESKQYFGIIFYYIYNKNRKNKSIEPAFKFEIKQFVALSENEIYSQCIKWVEENLNGEYKIIEKETIIF